MSSVIREYSVVEFFGSSHQPLVTIRIIASWFEGGEWFSLTSEQTLPIDAAWLTRIRRSPTNLRSLVLARECNRAAASGRGCLDRATRTCKPLTENPMYVSPTFDCRRLEEMARCYLPREATDVWVDKLSDYRFEVRAKFPLNFDNRLPRAADWARQIADGFQSRGIYLAFDVNPSFGFHATFERVS